MSWNVRGPRDADALSAESRAELSGAVLAGGASRRFGSDKGRHVWRGRTLLEHALASLVLAEDVLVVGAAPDSTAGARAGADGRALRASPAMSEANVSAPRFVADVRPGFGALSGVQAALVHAKRQWVCVLACDMPCVPVELWQHLLARAEGHRVVVPEGPAGLEPLAAIYHRDAVPAIEAIMDRGGGPLHALPQHLSGRIVPWAELRERFDAGIFLNANRRADLP